MKLIDFYSQAVRLGRCADPRKRKGGIKSFADSSILCGDPDTQVSSVMVGIDVEVGEILLADRIRQKDKLDLVIAHHPEGRSYAHLHEVISLQVDLLKQAGLPAGTASRLIEERRREVERRILSQNHNRAVDAAKILGLPFMNLHTPADNQVHAFLEDFFKKNCISSRTLGEAVNALKAIPEYRIAERFGVGPRVVLGNPARKTGKIMLEMTGGTEGPKEAMDKLYRAGVRTLISMHSSEEHLKKAREANLSVIIAGHISSDVLGLNLLLDGIERHFKQELKVVECSGFTRIKRR